MSFIIQLAEQNDFPSLFELAQKYCMTNLPSDKKLLRHKIEVSQQSFNEILPREERSFLFVLKLLKDKNKVIGSSQLTVKCGTKTTPNYSLKIETKNTNSYMQLKKNEDGPSYLGGLVLDQSWRRHTEKPGKQISLIRFLFTAMNLNLFKSYLHAEIAPWLDEKGENPFFKYFVQKYVDLTVQEIDYLTLTNKDKLFENFPKHKIFISLLPQIVQKTLGCSGKNSAPAEHILKQQNFQFIGEVDPFDGGPYMQAKTKEVPLVKHTRRVNLKQKPQNLENEKTYLWGKTIKERNFEGGLLKGCVQKDNFFISYDGFKAFSLQEGEPVFIAEFC